ncbi:pentapeptide repeat-containing protein [Sabulibacter ruber]|uniref:pentapeptide repeat-containing protein n=1 Tax=Sabulibacter ruber TaxID=2811901 RepID=UPI001A95AB61|nr:pentapeptide repeat-containing protein [Sabulibacter ruber]
MKKTFSLLLLLWLVLPALVWAQNTVPAADVIARINRGEAVKYENATITGDLDLTQLQNKTLKQHHDAKEKRGHKEYVSTVTAPISFVNCTFQGNVLAYYNSNDKNADGQPDLGEKVTEGDVYNTNFDKDVRFENCVFEQRSAFKYTEFKQEASFAGTTFRKEAFFKYSKFAQGPDFSKAKFNQQANFKYVKFPEKVSFNGATFQEEANFKYASFSGGADFQKATFNGLANLKYATLSDPVQWKGASFNGGQDLKYTSLNKSSFSSAALKKMTE